MSEHLLSQPMNPRQATAASLGEQMSALMDGELAREQVRFLLRGVEAQPGLARRWANYQLISTCLKREFVAVALPANFAESVIGRLDGDAASVAGANRARRIGFGVLRWVGGGAIAAAVAVVALNVSRPVGNGAGTPAVASAGRTSPLLQSPFLPQPYLPLARPLYNTNSPVFSGDAVQPVSLERVLPDLYLPEQRIELVPGRVEAYRVPLRVPQGWPVAGNPSAAGPARQ